MKYNWNYLLKLEDVVKKDKNIAIILDKLFSDFVYIEKHDINNETIIVANNINDDIKTDYVIGVCKDKNSIYIALEDECGNKSYEIKISILPDKVKAIVNSIIISKKDRYSKECKRVQDSFRYTSDFKKDISLAVIDTSIYNYDDYDKDIDDYLVPDLRCRTYMKRNKDIFTEKNVKYFGTTPICDDATMYKSKLPICLLLQNNHGEFLSYFMVDYNRSRAYTKRNKIGF